MERLEKMKEHLMGCVEGQIYGNLQDVDAKELGEAIDMIKDLAEAIYYCTITEAMGKEEEKPTHGTMYYDRNVKPMYQMPYPIETYDPIHKERYPMMYMDGGNRGSGGNSGGTNYMSRDNGGNNRPYRIEDYEMIHDPKEGKSGWRRKMYMESKYNHQDKNKQMQELENYMQELTSDMTEIIADASPEEKQLLQQKIAMLAQKIK